MEPATQTQDWMVLECRACGARMKSLRHVARTSRILCPKCRTPVPTTDSGTGSQGEIRGEMPEPAQLPASRPDSFLPGRREVHLQGDTSLHGRSGDPGAARSSHHPEFDGSKPGMPELPDRRSDGRKRRRKKRKRVRKYFRPLHYLELTDWNTSDLDGLPEAEISADPWTDVVPLPEDVVDTGEENEWVVEEVDEEGNITRQIKKVRRKPIARFAQRFFRRFTRFSRGLVFLLVALSAGAGLYGFRVLQQKFAAPPPDPVREIEIDREVLTSDDFYGAQRAVKNFMMADGVEEKLKYVRLPEYVRPLMERWYQDHFAGPIETGDSVKEAESRDKVRFGDVYMIFLAMPVIEPDPLNPGYGFRRINYFAVEEIRDSSGKSEYKVDWETSVGYQEMSFEDFELRMPRTPQTFRVSLKQDTYYTAQFPREDWICARMTYPGHEDVLMYGYIRRGTNTSLALNPLLEAGASVACIVTCRYPDGELRSRKHVIIESLEHDSWYFSEEQLRARRMGR